MSTKKIIITGTFHPIALKILKRDSSLVIDYKPDLPYEQLLEIIEEYDCIMSRSETTIDRTLIERAKKLSVIARGAVGIGNIDVDYATQKGILVFNVPGQNTNSAAELSLLLILSTLRKLPQAHQSMMNNQWNRHEFTGVELWNKTVGIIGLGNVGSRLARFLHSFNCNLLVYDPYVTESYCEQYFCKKVSFETLLKQSDIISLHVPKNKETTNMIDQDQFALMKRGVFIINAARGGIINEKALEQALENRKVLGIGIDTWEKEPIADHPLKSAPCITMTPHIGASTYEAQIRIAETVSKETIHALQGKIVSNPVNLPQIKSIGDIYLQKYSVLAERLGSISRQYIGTSFSPKTFHFLYRGQLKEEDWALIKLSYMKGFLKTAMDNGVSYVNTLQIANKRGYNITENADQKFSYYDSAIRISIQGKKEQFSIGGTVFGKEHLRLSYLNGFSFEIEPTGTILFVENKDSPGVIGHIGHVLAKHEVNINQFELSRKVKGGDAMAMLLIDSDINASAIQEIAENPLILNVIKTVL